MAGVGRPPKENRQNQRDVPERGEWTPAAGSGWQHGEVPKPPARLSAVSRETWATWFGAWFASYWTPDDLPMLRQVIKLYDKTERDEASSAELTQFRQLIDAYGITPKGQQDRRWKRPETPVDAQDDRVDESPYAGLRVVAG